MRSARLTQCRAVGVRTPTGFVRLIGAGQLPLYETAPSGWVTCNVVASVAEPTQMQQFSGAVAPLRWGGPWWGGDALRHRLLMGWERPTDWRSSTLDGEPNVAPPS